MPKPANKFARYLVGFHPIVKRILIVGLDALLVPFSLWLALSLRLGEKVTRFNEHAVVFIALTLFSIAVFVNLGLYRAVMRYAGWRVFERIVLGVFFSSCILFAIQLLIHSVHLPRSTFIIYGLVALPLIGGSRWFARRLLRPYHTEGKGRPVAIYGAGAGGRQLATILMAGTDYRPDLFLDDNPLLHGRHVQGIDVLDPEAPSLMDELERRGVKEILLSIPSATPAQRRRILERLEPLPFHVRTVPGMQEIVSSTARLDQLREIDIGDLLGRPPVPPDAALLDRCIRGQSVLVTGAAGSIGSELCRQVIAYGSKKLVLLEHSEYGLYSIDAELRQFVARSGAATEIIPLLGSVTDVARLDSILSAYPIDTVYHAAAYKHVPLVEHNPLEGLKTNALGTWRTAQCALRHGVRRFVLISTDKAVRPTNVMGASKRIAEMSLQSLQREARGETIFSMVRFGNVLGSSGSVVPLFRKQIDEGGPVTVTHPEVTRYFMTIPEAVQLVIQAGAMAEGGDVFVLDMGEPVKIVDLARRMIRLTGYEVRDARNPDGIEIVFSGLRPGEKLYEELLIGHDVSGTSHPKIMRAMEEMLPPEELELWIDRLAKAIENSDVAAARGLLSAMVKGYAPSGGIEDFVWKERDSRPANGAFHSSAR